VRAGEFEGGNGAHRRNRNWKKKEKIHSWENKSSKCAHGQFGSFLTTENNRTQSGLDQTEARDWTRWQVRLFALNSRVIGNDEIFVIVVK
jgi:hypothetical protein